MGMENVRRNIESNYANFVHRRLPQVMLNDSPWHIDAVGGRPTHQFMRDNWLSNRIFKFYDDIVDHCCFAWNNLVNQPWLIMSIGCGSGHMCHDQYALA